MLSSFKDIRNTFIFDHGAEEYPVGILVDFVINPESGKMEALWIKTGFGLKLLDPKDIEKWTMQKIVIPSENDLGDPEKSPRLEKIMQREVAILKAKVFTKDKKKYLGRVEDFTFDTISPRILSILVQGGFLGWGHKRIIPHSKIEKINEEGIFVTENEEAVKEKIPDTVLNIEKPVREGEGRQ